MITVCYMISYLVVLVLMLVNVAFLTLLERKVLSYIQTRKGPNKISFIGILQPMADVVKLFAKEGMYLLGSNYYFYYFSPMFSIFFVLIMWLVMPLTGGLVDVSFSWVFLLMLFGFTVYPILISGWASNSKYSVLGAVRGVAQMVSYEVILTLIVFLVLMMSEGMVDVSAVMKMNEYYSLIILMPFVYVLWIFCCVMESNRSPFDFSEGESELVSGFNTEYSAGGFALIFMAEYLSILFLSMLGAILVVQGSGIVFFLVLVVNSFVWIWLRGTFPRHRYDLVMYMTWKSLLPLLGNLLLFLVMVVLSFYF